MPTQKLPGIPGFIRINKIICSESVLAGQLSKPSYPVGKPGGKTELFPPEVAAVVIHLGRKNLDPNSVSREIVINAAITVFNEDYAAVYLKDAPVPAQPLTPVKTSTPKAPAKPKAAKPKAASAPAKPKAALPAAKPAKATSAPAPVPAPVPVPAPAVAVAPKPITAPKPTPSTPKPSVAKAGDDDDGADSTSEALPPKAVKREYDVVFLCMISAVNLLMGAEQVLEAHDKYPGNERRLTSLGELIRECSKWATPPKL